MQPHKSSYWIFPKIEEEKEFVERISSVCQVYQKAVDKDNKIIVTCTDEKCGIQAIENKETKPPEKGKNKKVDPEYTRNGTSCLIAGLDVSSGCISAYSQGQTRKEDDFVKHVDDIISGNPKAEHIIVCDQLNTHKSESLVKSIAKHINYTDDLGQKGKRGILKSMESRMEFLETKTHRIRFQFTPKHCSWMNQIENWFGVLQKRVIRGGQFPSVSELESKIEAYIKYQNKYLAKPIIWKFNGEKYLLKLSG